MKKRRLFCVLLAAALLLMPVAVHADTGPKPSVQIKLEGFEAPCYGTLLSAEPGNGPWSVWDGGEIPEYILERDEGKEVWQAFADYRDADGFCFLQEWWDCSEGAFAWTYYPPEVFKVLLYFPESGTFLVSEVQEVYAFDSYFTVRAAESGLAVERSYEYGGELFSLAARIVVTVALELGLAWLFRYREKRQLRFLLVLNLITQVGLNVTLNLINYAEGFLSFMVAFIFLEMAVLAVEALVCAVGLTRVSERPTRAIKAIGYAVCANVLSFLAGYLIAVFIPGFA